MMLGQDEGKASSSIQEPVEVEPLQSPTSKSRQIVVKTFVSYHRGDNQLDCLRSIIKNVFDDIQKDPRFHSLKLDLFIDVESINFGADWRQRIRDEIIDSHIFLPIITPGYLLSGACRYELKLYKEMNAKCSVPLYWSSRKQISNELEEKRHSRSQSEMDEIKHAMELVDETNAMEGILPGLVSLMLLSRNDYEFVGDCIRRWLIKQLKPVISNTADMIRFGSFDTQASSPSHTDDDIETRGGLSHLDLKQFVGMRFTMNLRGAQATAHVDSKGKFVVESGSLLASSFTNTCANSVKTNRKRHAKDIDKNNRLTCDIAFPSASAAAGFVGGCTVSGTIAWQDRTGTTLGELANA